MNVWFGSIARRTAHAAGSPVVFALAFGVVLLWALTGPIFRFSTTWQLVINTGTTIVTFLMVFLIQNSQNRDSAAMQSKLDELLRASAGARSSMIDLEESTDAEIEQHHNALKKIAAAANISAQDAGDEDRELSERTAAARIGESPVSPRDRPRTKHAGHADD